MSEISEESGPVAESRRREFARSIGALALDRGIGELGLREMARHAGTSDRMLIYYFGSREALVAAVLGELSGQLAERLADDAAAGPLPAGELLTVTLARMQAPDVRPYMRLWAEVIARGTRGEAPFDAVAVATVDGWQAWVEARVDAPDAERPTQAAALLAIVEGISLLSLLREARFEAVGPWLAQRLDAGRV